MTSSSSLPPFSLADRQMRFPGRHDWLVNCIKKYRRRGGRGGIAKEKRSLLDIISLDFLGEKKSGNAYLGNCNAPVGQKSVGVFSLQVCGVCTFSSTVESAYNTESIVKVRFIIV